MVATTTNMQKRQKIESCDLLKNIYLCGSNNNQFKVKDYGQKVVICLKISIFVVATTTRCGTM